MEPLRILLVRLGAMGDIVHALPVAATLKRNLPGCRLTWAVEPRWASLLDGNPCIDRTITVDRRSWTAIRSAWTELTRGRFDIAIDLQGLLKSALVARVSRAAKRIGFHRTQAREPLAARFYTLQRETSSAHVVDRYIELAQAAGAVRSCREFHLPQGRGEDRLPACRFVLACPLAGWTSKQWPHEYYVTLAHALNRDGTPLVVNGPPSSRATLERIEGAHVHTSGIEGLIDATRKAAAVIGVDSGPLHLAAALSKPGVALFGPTDPARNGPYCATMTVLRNPKAVTSYKRGLTIDPSMRSLTPDDVLNALRVRMEFHSAGSTA